jgi:hypothetical protein
LSFACFITSIALVTQQNESLGTDDYQCFHDCHRRNEMTVIIIIIIIMNVMEAEFFDFLRKDSV